MHKSLREWTVEYLEQIEDTEHTHLEFKCSETVKDIATIGDVVSAFANYDGGHIILGCKRQTWKLQSRTRRSIRPRIQKGSSFLA